MKCEHEKVLPIGLSSELNKDDNPNNYVKVFCPRCRKIYNPRPMIPLDGAFFGPNMVHIFIDEKKIVKHRQKYEPFVLTAFGFKIYEPSEEEEEEP